MTKASIVPPFNCVIVTMTVRDGKELGINSHSTMEEVFQSVFEVCVRPSPSKSSYRFAFVRALLTGEV